MKKVVGKIIVLLMALTIAAGITACGNKAADTGSAGNDSDEKKTAETADSSEENKKPEKKENKSKDAVKIEDIDWNVDESVVDGERTVAMSLTNNSDYTLAGFDISFIEKDDLSEDDREAFFNDIKEGLNATDDDMEQLRSREIGMHAKTEHIIEPGDSVNDVKVYYYQGFFYMKKIDHYALVTPDIAEISYVDGDKIYKEYYDFKSKKYSMDDSTEDAQYWTTSKLGSMVPKPEAPVIKENGRDDEECFMYEAYGLTMDDFDTYIDSCKEMGYTEDPSEFEGFYSADNAEGYNVYMNYDKEKGSVSVIFKAPDEDKEKAEAPDPEEEDIEEVDSDSDAKSETGSDETEEKEIDSSGVSAKVKDTLDEYEAFFDDYIAFMKKYKNATYKDLDKMIDEYSDYIDKYSDIYGKLIDMGTEKMSAKDYAYYTKVLARIEKKLADV